MQDDFGGAQHNFEGAKPPFPPLPPLPPLAPLPPCPPAPPQIPLCDLRITPSHVCNHSPSTMPALCLGRGCLNKPLQSEQINKQTHPKAWKRVLPRLQLIQPNKESHIYSTELCHHKKEWNVPVNCLNCSKDAPVLWYRRVWFISAPGLLAHTLLGVW